MEGFGVHTSMWTMSWDQEGCEAAVAKAHHYGMDFLEIALLDPLSVDASHSRRVLEAAVGHRLRFGLSLPTPLPRARQELIQGANLQQQSQLEAEAESIRAQLDYPMALDVVMGFLVESRSVSRPRSPCVMGTLGGHGPGAAGMGTIPSAPLRPLAPDSTAKLRPLI